MSSSDVQLMIETIKGLLEPDNQKRKLAEEKLNVLLQNKEQLCLCLTQVLISSNEPLVLTYAAIIIRKIFILKGDEIATKLWTEFKEETKNEVKKNLLQSLKTCQNKNAKKKISDALINVYTCVEENEEKWEDLLRYVVDGFKLELNETNLPNIEESLSLLSNIYNIGYEELKKGIDLFIHNFNLYFKTTNLNLKSKTVKCISELLSSSLSKKESKLFKEFIYYILETILQCLNANDNDNLEICLESLDDLCNYEPKILRKNFSDLFTLMGKITENQNIDDKLRKISFELLINLIEGTPKIINKDEDKLKLLVQGLFKYAMEMEDSIDDDWLTPNNDTYINDEFIPEEKLDEACSLLQRLFEAIDNNNFIKIVSNNIIQLFQHSQENWKYKYIAYISFAEIVEYVEDFGQIQEIINMILADLANSNVKIQYACLYCVAEISDQHNPDFQNEYHSKVIPSILNILQNTNVLRIRLQCCDALECFVEHLTDSDSAIYINNSMEALFSIFIKDDTVCPTSLKEAILNVVEQFINANEEEFKKYAEKCLKILIEYLKQLIQENKRKSIIGVLLESISTVGPLCPEYFESILGNIIEVFINIHVGLNSYKENIGNYLLSAWEKIVPNLTKSHKDKIPQIVNSLLVLLQKPPEMSIASNPNEKIDIATFLKDDDNKEEKDKEKVSLTTSETEEFAIFIDILNLLFENSPDILFSFVNPTYEIASKLLHYPNEDIQCSISDTFNLLIGIIKKNVGINTDEAFLHGTSKKYISDLITQLDKEKDFSVIVDMLDNTKEIVKKAGMFLTTQEINELAQKILSNFDRVEKIRISLINQKKETEKEIEDDKKKGNNKIFSDDEDDGSEDSVIEDMNEQISELEEVLTAFNEFFGTLFDTHKQLTLEVVDLLIKNYLPKYFNEKSSNFEKKLGLYLIDDMAEFLDQKLLQENIWNEIYKCLITYSNNDDFELKNSACFGIGCFAKNTTQNFNTYCDNLLTALVNSFETKRKDLNKDDKDDMKFAKDNSVSALGKIIKYHGQELGDSLQKWIDLWLNNMPIVKDNEEGKIMNSFLMEIITKSPQLVMGNNYSNLPHIFKIFAKGCDTDFVDDDTNAKIKEFIAKIKEVPQMDSIVKASFDQVKKGKLLNKMKSLYGIK